MTVTAAQAKSTALLAVTTAAVATAGASIVKKQAPKLRIVIGAGVVGLALVGLGDVVPGLVYRFAWLVLITSLMTGGYVLAKPLIDFLNRS